MYGPDVKRRNLRQFNFWCLSGEKKLSFHKMANSSMKTKSRSSLLFMMLLLVNGVGGSVLDPEYAVERKLLRIPHQTVIDSDVRPNNFQQAMILFNLSTHVCSIAAVTPAMDWQAAFNYSQVTCRRASSAGLTVVTTLSFEQKTLFLPFLRSVLHSQGTQLNLVVLGVDFDAAASLKFCQTFEQGLSSEGFQILSASEDELIRIFHYNKKSNENSKHVPVGTMFRLLLPELLDVETVVYLDIDTIVLKSLETLWNGSVCLQKGFGSHSQPHAICAVRNSGYIDNLVRKKSRVGRAKRCLLAPLLSSQFNAGVLRLNLAELRERFFSWFAISLSRRFNFNDQDILIFFAAGNFSSLPSEYNHWGGRANKATYVLHFKGALKPLNTQQHPYRHVWMALNSSE